MTFNEPNTIEHFIIHHINQQKPTMKNLTQKLLN